MHISLYEIFFCQSVIYSIGSGENHKVDISLYDIFFCPNAIYSMQSAKNHKVKCVLRKSKFMFYQSRTSLYDVSPAVCYK